MPNRLGRIAPVLCISLFGCSEGARQMNEKTATVQGPNEDAAAAQRAKNHTMVAPHSTTDTASIRSFVQDFYDWYLPLARGGNGSPAWYRVLQSRDSVLSAELALGMRADSMAQAAIAGSVTGLNFDPFLASQDPCERYVVGEIRQRKVNYGVTVRAVCSSAYKMPDVILEVGRNGQSWQFVNFFYDGTDLRQLLCQYAKEAARGGQVSPNARCGAS